MILWALLNISMLCEQAVRRGGFSQVTDSMWLVQAFQLWYIADALYNEPAIFTVMDITTDGFGFMLAFGDLTWVPFVYSLQARYLVFNQLQLGPYWTIGILFVNLLGYHIFRTANGDKNNVHRPVSLRYLGLMVKPDFFFIGRHCWEVNTCIIKRCMRCFTYDHKKLT